jgi:hypothetical protein
MSAWGEEIREKLKEIDRTVPQMARALHYSEDYIRNVLSSKDEPSDRVKSLIEEWVGIKERRT